MRISFGFGDGVGSMNDVRGPFSFAMPIARCSLVDIRCETD